MITPRSRIRRILKHLNGYRTITDHDFKSFLPRESFLVDEEPIAIYRDPYSSEGNFILFTDKRLFLNKADCVESMLLADLKEVVGPKEKETASSLVIHSKDGRCLKVSVYCGDQRVRPVIEFVRLFDRLISDLSRNSTQ